MPFFQDGRRVLTAARLAVVAGYFGYGSAPDGDGGGTLTVLAAGTVIFAGSFRGVTQAIPLAIFAGFQSDIDAAVALSILVLGFAFVVILAIIRHLTRTEAGQHLS